MERRFSVFFGLFLYDCFRLAFSAERAGRVVFSPEGTLWIIPLLVFAVPSVLFPLMSFFLWFDFSRYAAFKMLYVAGKCSLCVFQAAGLLFPFVSGHLQASDLLFYLSGTVSGPLLLAFAACGLLDLASAVIAAFSPRKNRRVSYRDYGEDTEA